VSDELGPDVDLVPGSPSGRPVEAGRRVTWALGAIPEGGLPELFLAVVPRRTGTLPTNASAVARYTAAGTRYSFTFPVPTIEVLDRPPPTATTTPTATVRPPTATATPRRATGLYLPLVVKPHGCDPNRRKPADIVLVIDSSTSMTGDKLSQAVAATRTFLGLVSADRDRVGLVAFSAGTHVVPIGQDFGALSAALDSLAPTAGTRIDLGLYEALKSLYDTGRPDASHVAVLLSDGRPDEGTVESAVQQAELMRAYAVTLFVVGLGADADAALLRSLAARPDHFYLSPTPADLQRIYESIAVRLPCD
jgi:uncharacterized protein YegL